MSFWTVERMDEVDVVTFGCRLNSFESEVMRRHARAASLRDTVIVHTCAVTAEADRQARQAIRRLRRERPEARIVVTGCGAQVAAQAYAAMPEIDHVVGNAEKLRPETWNGLPAAPRLQVGDIMLVRETAGHLVDGFDGRTRAFLEVQQGCDHRCTFCIIPYGRGPSRSVPAEGIVAQARALVANGYREVVITGVDIASYGKDLPEAPTLGRMLKQLLALVPELPRRRYSVIRACRRSKASSVIGLLTLPHQISSLVDDPLDDELVVGRTARVLTGDGHQRPTGGDRRFAPDHGLLIKRRRAVVPMSCLKVGQTQIVEADAADGRSELLHGASLQFFSSGMPE